MTELERTDVEVRIRVEGHLDRATLPILEQTLTGCVRQGCRRVSLETDGVVAVAPGALTEALRRLPPNLRVRWCTSRGALGDLLRDLGLDVQVG